MTIETSNSGGMNALLAQSLTVYGDTMSAQVRDTEKLSGEPDPTLVLHHLDNAPRSTENGHPYVLTTTDAVLLRDVLNAATARGYLPHTPEGTCTCPNFRPGMEHQVTCPTYEPPLNVNELRYLRRNVLAGGAR